MTTRLTVSSPVIIPLLYLPPGLDNIRSCAIVIKPNLLRNTHTLPDTVPEDTVAVTVMNCLLPASSSIERDLYSDTTILLTLFHSLYTTGHFDQQAFPHPLRSIETTKSGCIFRIQNQLFLQIQLHFKVAGAVYYHSEISTFATTCLSVHTEFSGCNSYNIRDPSHH